MGVFGEFLEFLSIFGFFFSEGWRSRDRLMDMYGLYWFDCGCMYRYTVRIGKCEVFTKGSLWRFRCSNGGLDTIAEALRTLSPCVSHNWPENGEKR